MGARGKKHGVQKRRNTLKTKGNQAVYFAAQRRIEQREDEEDRSFMDQVQRAVESGYQHRKRDNS